jgi:RHS repeat-associated protein
MTTAAICATREVSWWPSFYRGASYGLDPVGNRMSANSTLPGINPIAGAYNADDEISSETYDANGNVIATGGKTYTYDSQNHMITANNGQVTMIYDGDGNRVSKTVGGVTTQYLVDDLNPTGYAQVVEEVVNGAVTRQYTYGLQRISQNLSPAVSGNSTWTPSFYVYDGGGSVRQLTNSNGTVTDEYEYDAYGNSFTKSGTTPNNYLYRGEQYDQDLGLYYLRARYYNPNTGRFMSRDPEDGDETDPKTLHKYVYANGDPVNAVDPTGRMAAEYALPLGIIAIPTTKVLLALGGTVGCLLLWEGGNVWANSVVASNGGYVMQLPCFALPMSKGGKQNVVHQWVLEMAKGMQGDVCAALKQIMSEARKAGDSSLFNAAKATYKATCRGYGG